MGNTASDVTSGVKKQAEGGARSQPLYQLIDLSGGGILVELAKQASNTKNYAALDEAIKTRVEPFLYNNGLGKEFHVSTLVLMRNRERSKHKHIFKNEAQFDNYVEPVEEVKDPTMYRHVCWKLDERGNVGESCLHLCVLNATPVHEELAKRLLQFYPKLINDIYMSDEYYGENVLHMAIVNEDPQMVKFFLDNGANVNERCTGAFMTPEDQKYSRTDTLAHEHVNCVTQTNYQGLVYWGEYPASFAACLGQEECYRLILAKGANPNAQDSNGNTVLQMLVIHDKKAMFNTAYELGAEMTFKNNLNLTPMTLAAKLARKELFFHILNISREIYWQIGNVTCAAYPLDVFDTIDTESGGIQKESALNLIVFGESAEHLELMEGPVDDLLQIKWKTFIKSRFYRQFILFAIYFFITVNAFVLRPLHNQPLKKNLNFTLGKNESYSQVNNNATINSSSAFGSADLNSTQDWLGPCADRLVTPADYIRLGCEGIMFLGACMYLLGAAWESHFLGASLFFENLATVPSRVLFLVSRILVLGMAVLRLMCWREAEDIVAVVVMLSTALYFLFFCRGFKTVGPFVVMIYRMITGDLLRFVIIYLVFVMGFSQAFFIIFRSYRKPKTPNPMRSAAESVIAMFLMSLSSFDTTFESFQHTDHEELAWFLFIVYMAIVAILLINMLIAMMGNTYTKIAETRNEWQRQWARIVLVVERGVTPEERLYRQSLYSQPMANGSRAIVLRLNQTEDEREEMEEVLEVRRYHDKAVTRRIAKQIEGIPLSRRRSIVDTLHQQQLNDLGLNDNMEC